MFPALLFIQWGRPLANLGGFSCSRMSRFQKWYRALGYYGCFSLEKEKYVMGTLCSSAH